MNLDHENYEDRRKRSSTSRSMIGTNMRRGTKDTRRADQLVEQPTRVRPLCFTQVPKMRSMYDHASSKAATPVAGAGKRLATVVCEHWSDVRMNNRKW